MPFLLQRVGRHIHSSFTKYYYSSINVQVKLDHFVLTVEDISNTVDFYTNILGMKHEEFIASDQSKRVALKFDTMKINLHEYKKEFLPNAQHPTPGSHDLCFVIDTNISEMIAKLKEQNINIIQGPIERTGANGIIQSIYIRDPDNNLIELSNYISCTDINTINVLQFL